MRIGILGVGRMGEAILKGLLSSGKIKAGDVFFNEIVEERKEYIIQNYGVTFLPKEDMIKEVDAIIVAVKPQDMEKALSGLDAGGKLFISIAAGVSSERVASFLKNGNRVVRVMPNLPLLVGEGMIAVFEGPFSSSDDVEITRDIFSSMGEVVILDEKYADAVTALSGSGPGFVAVLMEAMADGGVLVGLPRDISYKLTHQVFLGAAKYIKEVSLSPAELKDQVASPGGTTISGIWEMEKSSVRAGIIGAIKKAYERSKEL